MEEKNQNNIKKIPTRPVPPPRPVPPKVITPPSPPQVLHHEIEEVKEVVSEETQVEAQVETHVETNEIKNTKQKEKNSKPKKLKEKTQTEKEKKVKEPKQKKEKKKASKKKKVTILVVSLLLSILLAGGVYFGVNFVKDGKQIETPENLTVYVLNQKVYVEVDENNRAQKYEFLVKNGTQTFSVSSNDNTLDISAYMRQAGEYKISAKYLGKRASAHSKYSESISYKNYVVLDAPTIAYDAQTKTLSFVPVVNAVGYNLYYGEEKEFIDAGDGNQNISVRLDSQSFFSGKKAGLYVFAVEAVGEDYFKSSLLSNKVTVENGTQLIEVSNINYNKQTKVVSFNSELETTIFEVKLLFSTGESLITLSYEAESLSSSHNFYIGAYNFTGDISKIQIVAKGDGNYAYDSEVVEITVS